MGSVGRIWEAYCKAPCSWLPGREELYSAAITERVKSIGQPFNGEWAALSRPQEAVSSIGRGHVLQRKSGNQWPLPSPFQRGTN